MKALFGAAVILVISLCGHAQGNRTIDWPQAATAEACVKGDGGRCTLSTLRALEIVGMTVNGSNVVPGQPFAAEGEWLKTFVVKVKNVSKKPISSVRLHFALPDARYPKESAGFTTAGFSMEYGKGLSTGIEYGNRKPIAPGDEIELSRNEAHYIRDRDFIAKRTGVTDFYSVVIGNTTVQFEDGTVWWTYRLPMAISETVQK